MHMEVYLIQAGLGDCILVRCGKETKKVNILIDSGTKKDHLQKALNHIATNKEKLDMMIFTHDDNDHINGAYQLLKTLERKETRNIINREEGSVIKRMADKSYSDLFEKLTEDRIFFNFGGNGTEKLLGVREAKGLFASFEKMNIENLGYVLADAVGPSDVPYPNMIQLQWKSLENRLESTHMVTVQVGLRIYCADRMKI